MRLLVSNPDTLGDLILRQPLYRALADAGHELMLVVRPAAAPLVRHVAPGAQVVELPHEVYAHDLPERWDKFTGLFDAARAFAPDALVVAPYRWTLFEERLSEELPAGVKRFGMSGHLYRGDPHHGRPPESRVRFDVVAEVCEDAPEVEKNAALASAILGEQRSLPYPRIDVPDPDRSRAAQVLAELGLTPGEYWVACVTGTSNVSLKAWYRENWADTLARWARERGRTFLFVGLASEEADARAVREAMGEVGAANTRVWMPPGGTVDELLGLTALSAGYVGHDTGPMHVAAALGKPVLAVFGGGHKLRFQPAVEPSVTVTVGVSCRGCQWVCSFAESHCVKAVPVDEVVKAANDLEDGRVGGREARVLEPSHELQARMIHESARVAQERLRAAAEATRQLHAAEAAARADGERLREKESMIQQQDQQLREKEDALHAQHALLQEHAEQLHRSADEARQLRDHAAAADERLRANAGELSRLQNEFEAKSNEASQLASTIGLQREDIERLHGELAESLRLVEEANRQGREAAARQAEEVGLLREQLRKLEQRVRTMEPLVRAQPRTFRQFVIDLLIGPQHHYPKPPKSLPGVTVVTVTHNDAATIRDTVESVVGQNHAHVQYVVVDLGSTDDTLAILDEYRDRIAKVVTRETFTGTAAEALHEGYAQANYELVTKLDPGDVYEPGALLRVAEHFRDHPRHRAAVFEEAVADGGWRFPAPPRPAPDVYQILNDAADAAPGGAFVLTHAYTALGGLNRERGDAAEWDFWVRTARRYGIRRGTGHVRTTRSAAQPRGGGGGGSPADREHFIRARELFLASFGVPGRVRCKLIYWANRFDEALRRGARGRLSFPIARIGDQPAPTGVPPARVPSDQPISPLTGRLPDRLLFSARDTAGRDDGITYVYYDSAAGTALAYPPLDLDKLRAIYEGGSVVAKQVTPADPSRLSPYAGYRGRGATLARMLSRVRSPYWWFRRPDFGDRSVAELLDTLDGRVPQRGVAVRFLNVACFEGGVLDALKTETDWTLSGTETNPVAANTARAKGHTVWETSAEDAALSLPLGQQFDVIYLGRLLEHLADPLLVLRRLRQILAPGGRVVFDTPNLDSRLLDAFGPTWSQWQTPYHRTLIGRRALRRLARLAAFRVERCRTVTHPLDAVRSVQLNDLGLGATVPPDAEFPPGVASRGVLLAGWARLLWDWRGRGDYMYAVLHGE